MYVYTKGLLGCPAIDAATLLLQPKDFTYIRVPIAATKCGIIKTKSALSADSLRGLLAAAMLSFFKPRKRIQIGTKKGTQHRPVKYTLSKHGQQAQGC